MGPDLQLWGRRKDGSEFPVEVGLNPVRNEAWNRGVYDELLFSFDELIKSDRSILEIVDADWVYLRSESQRHAPQKIQLESKYEDIFALRRSNQQIRVEHFYRPPELRRVNDDRRVGMLTSSGIMRLTSGPESTKPISRGVWLLETIIGEEMHPPENVPPLSESEKQTASKKANGIVEALKLNTSKAACRGCATKLTTTRPCPKEAHCD